MTWLLFCSWLVPAVQCSTVQYNTVQYMDAGSSDATSVCGGASCLFKFYGIIAAVAVGSRCKLRYVWKEQLLIPDTFHRLIHLE